MQTQLVETAEHKLFEKLRKEAKTRVYRLRNGQVPESYAIRVGSQKRRVMLKRCSDKVSREIGYSPNQTSVFVEEWNQHAQKEQVFFVNGTLTVTSDNLMLQWFLALSPESGTLYEEVDIKKNSEADYDKELKEVELKMKISQLSDEKANKLCKALNPKRNIDRFSAKQNKAFINNDVSRKYNKIVELLEDPDMELISDINNFITHSILSFRKEKTEVWFNIQGNKGKMLNVKENHDPVNLIKQWFESNEDGEEALETLRAALAEKISQQ